MGLLDSGCCVDARCRRERLPSVPFDWRHHGAVTFCERALVVPAKSSAAALDVESAAAHSHVRIGSAKAFCSSLSASTASRIANPLQLNRLALCCGCRYRRLKAFLNAQVV